MILLLFHKQLFIYLFFFFGFHLFRSVAHKRQSLNIWIFIVLIYVYDIPQALSTYLYADNKYLVAKQVRYGN